MVPWKKDTGKKKAEGDTVDEKRQDDGEKEQRGLNIRVHL